MPLVSISRFIVSPDSLRVIAVRQVPYSILVGHWRRLPGRQRDIEILIVLHDLAISCRARTYLPPPLEASPESHARSATYRPRSRRIRPTRQVPTYGRN